MRVRQWFEMTQMTSGTVDLLVVTKYKITLEMNVGNGNKKLFRIRQTF